MTYEGLFNQTEKPLQFLPLTDQGILIEIDIEDRISGIEDPEHRARAPIPLVFPCDNMMIKSGVIYILHGFQT